MKGTDLQPAMAAIAQAEANGVMMYYALARLAKEQGLNDVAQTFIELANQEAVHAGFYAVLNGKVQKDFWQFVAGVAKAEYKGEESVKALADKVRAAGFTAAADEMEIFAKQEGHHGVVIDEILAKYAPKTSEAKFLNKKILTNLIEERSRRVGSTNGGGSPHFLLQRQKKSYILRQSKEADYFAEV